MKMIKKINKYNDFINIEVKKKMKNSQKFYELILIF